MSKYDDIIELPHPDSGRHPRMSIHDRAAQFSPFAALTGFGAEIEETARLTEERPELDENARAELDERFRVIGERIAEQPEVRITFFRPDERKSGGACVTVTGRVKKLDRLKRTVLLTDCTEIPMDDICAADGAWLEISLDI